MKLRSASLALAGAVVLAACSDVPTGTVDPASRLAKTNGSIGINVVLTAPITDAARAQLSAYGRINDEIPEINALTMRVATADLAAVRALPIVAAAAPDAERSGAPIDAVAATNFRTGLSTWDQDAINVTNVALDASGNLVGSGRVISFTGQGVYVGVLDTGLLDSWRQYFPQERIATQYAKSFGGGGGESGTNVSEQPNKWEHDQNSHGTHVTSSIIGFQFQGVPFNGTAPDATIIPVKVLNQNGSGWSSVIARGITYIADLKAGPLSASPVVINMSLGGSLLDPMEKAAVDYAIAKGVIVVAAAGNDGEEGMHYPGAYAPVISVAASGWIGEWAGQRTNPALDTYFNYWWYAHDVPDPTNAADFYIADFSGRKKTGQDLDVAAPGSWVLGPYQTSSGKTSFFYLGGTSMASPHVAGIAALMAQKNHSLTGPQAETILEASALPLAAGSRTIINPNGTTTVVSWGADATGSGLARANTALSMTPAP